MNLIKAAFAIGAILVTASSALAYDKTIPESDAEWDAAISELDWKFDEALYQLADSKISLGLPDGQMLVLGDDAMRFEYLMSSVEATNTTASLVDMTNETRAVFQYFGSGYVTLDDWSDVDSTELLQAITRNTKEANKTRLKNGYPEMAVTGWLIEPYLDRGNDAVKWALVGVEGGNEFVNIVTLKLGRNGFEKITWVGSPSQYSNQKDFIAKLPALSTFNPEFQYADYRIGDEMAAFGIAGLVAATAGANSKAVKAGGAVVLATALALLKKFIFIPFIAALAFFRHLFKRKNQ